MDNFGTVYGLALSSGISAYLPLLSFSIAVRWFHLFPLSQRFSFVTQNGFITALVILTILDIIADKIPGLDSIWDTINTVLRPLAGAIVAGAAGTLIPTIPTPVIMILGGVVAALGHVTKSVTRLTASVSTFGCANTALSIVEDGLAIAGILLAIFAPVVMLAFCILFTIVFVIFAPLLFSALRYQLRIAASIFSWFIHTYFLGKDEPNAADFMLTLSDNERAHISQVILPNTPIYGGVNVLWLRRLDGKGLWNSRRTALSTWFVAIDGAIVLIPRSRPHLKQIVPFDQIQALALEQGLLMGSIRMLAQNGQAYNLTVLRDSLDTTVDLVEALHLRHHLPSSTRTQGSGTVRTRPAGPQRI